MKLLSVGALVASVFGNFFTRYEDESMEWCWAVPEPNKPDWDFCRPVDEMSVEYHLTVVGVSGGGNDPNSDVYMTVVGTNARSTEVQVASVTRGTKRNLKIYDRDLGSPQSVVVRSNTAKDWRCKHIRVQQSYRSWTFDCNGILNKRSRALAEFTLSGAESYALTVSTGASDKAGTANAIEVELIGSEGVTGRKFLAQGLEAGSQQTVRLQGREVGSLLGIRLIVSGRLEDPWFCDLISVRSGNGDSYEFPIRQWIGTRGKKSFTAYTGNANGRLAELPARQIDCDTTVADGEIGAVDNSPFVLQRVICPADCQADDFSVLVGSSIHPAAASICTAAILDGVLSNAGGEVILAIVDEVPRYYGVDNRQGLISQDYTLRATTDSSSFYLYQASSPDNLVSNVRVIGEDGKLSSSGRLELRRNGRWGTICSKGSNPTGFTRLAAEVACREMGFPYASVASEGCADVDGAFVCAGKGAYVSAAGVECTGKETSLTECAMEAPHKIQQCKSHNHDVAVTCSYYPPNGAPPHGTLRIKSSNGAVAFDGVGRLETYIEGQGWSTVCDDDWSAAAARVACKQMGFDGIRGNGGFGESCEDYNGSAFCGDSTSPIGMTRVLCDGSESNLLSCAVGQMLGKNSGKGDIYCSHKEDVIVRCSGNGDPTGGRKYVFAEPPLPRLPMARAYDGYRQTLNCMSTLKSTIKRVLSSATMPGTAVIGMCPEGCGDSDGIVKGTFIYTEDTPICKAAIHSGALPGPDPLTGEGDVGGEVIIIAGWSQPSYFASSRHGIESRAVSGDAGYGHSLLVSRPMPSMVLDAEPLKNNLFAARSALGGFGTENYISFAQGSSVSEPPVPASTSANALPEVSFQWSHGSGQLVPANRAPVLSAPDSFSMAIVFSSRGLTRGQELRLYVNGDCGGFGLYVSKRGEVTAEQTCNPHVLTARHSAPSSSTEADDLDSAMVVVVTFDSVTKFAKLFLNGRIVEAKVMPWVPFRLEQDFAEGILGIRDDGPSATLSVGQVESVTVYNGVLTAEEVSNEMQNLLLLSQLRNPSESGLKNRYTTDGRPCKATCVTGLTPLAMEQSVAALEKKRNSGLFGFLRSLFLQTGASEDGASFNERLALVEREISAELAEHLSSKRPALEVDCRTSLQDVAVALIRRAALAALDGNAVALDEFLADDAVRGRVASLLPEGASLRVRCPAECTYQAEIPLALQLHRVAVTVDESGETPAVDGVASFHPFTPICAAAVSTGRISPQTGGALTVTTRGHLTAEQHSASMHVLPSLQIPVDDSLASQTGVFDEMKPLVLSAFAPAFMVSRGRPAKQLACSTDGLFTTELQSSSSRVLGASLPSQSTAGRTSRLVRCPAGCSTESVQGKAQVIGDLLAHGGYSPKSSVCLAAVHAGVISAEKGGEVVVTAVPAPQRSPFVEESTEGGVVRYGVVALPPQPFVQYFAFHIPEHHAPGDNSRLQEDLKVIPSALWPVEDAETPTWARVIPSEEQSEEEPKRTTVKKVRRKKSVTA